MDLIIQASFIMERHRTLMGITIPKQYVIVGHSSKIFVTDKANNLVTTIISKEFLIKDKDKKEN
jgi:hypothetical protein